MYKNLYFETVKLVLDHAIASYCHQKGVEQEQVDQDIVAHIIDTANQHQNPDPSIDYANPLCRLGYMYVHAGVNATLFELTIKKSPSLSTIINGRANDKISVCAVGGGPGTELLSLAKYSLTTKSAPCDIEFTVLDNIPEWAESWTQLGTIVQDRMRSALNTKVSVSKSFLQMDVTSPTSYKSYAWLFEGIDIFVFNYLLSENQVHLETFRDALDEMVAKAPEGSM